MKTRTLRFLAVSAIYFSLNPALAAEMVGGTTAAASASVPASRIASRFEALAGSPENAASLVAGLRTGGAITLSSADSTSGVRFTPATTQMGYGNITRALSLAQRQLAAQGIAEPTPEQLNAALNGGTLTAIDGSGASRTVEMAGVLHLRSQGLGWGQIAHRLAVGPGNRPPTTTAVAATTTQGRIDLPGGSHRHGAVVAGDGSLMHGRIPGFSGPAQGRGTSRINASASSHAGRPPFVAGSSSLNMGSHGKNVAGMRGKGRL
ncbi:MAG: hypothetical protein WC540_02835 [Sulfuritalea sp.]